MPARRNLNEGGLPAFELLLYICFARRTPALKREEDGSHSFIAVHQSTIMKYFLIGFMGTGKSYWGKLWSQAKGLSFYDLDEEIEKAEGKKVTEIFNEKDEKYFRAKEKQILHTFFEKENFILSCGGGTPCFFNNMEKMNEQGVTIYLKTDIDELVKRLSAEKEIRPLIKEVKDELLKDFILQKLNDREPFYQKAMYHFNTAYLSVENFKKIIRRHE